MNSIATAVYQHDMDLPSEAATVSIARRLAAVARNGDVIALDGDLGAGKTCFARGFIAALTGQAEEAPSPTFTLVQTYDSARGTIWHFDLYRLARADDALELGLEDALADGITLIEWPERIAGAAAEGTAGSDAVLRPRQRQRAPPASCRPWRLGITLANGRQPWLRPRA